MESGRLHGTAENIARAALAKADAIERVTEVRLRAIEASINSINGKIWVALGSLIATLVAAIAFLIDFLLSHGH